MAALEAQASMEETEGIRDRMVVVEVVEILIEIVLRMAKGGPHNSTAMLVATQLVVEAHFHKGRVVSVRPPLAAAAAVEEIEEVLVGDH